MPRNSLICVLYPLLLVIKNLLLNNPSSLYLHLWATRRECLLTPSILYCSGANFLDVHSNMTSVFFFFLNSGCILWGVARNTVLNMFDVLSNSNLLSISCGKALNFGRYWEDSTAGWRCITLQLGRTPEAGR